MYLYQVMMEDELTADAKVGPPALATALPTANVYPHASMVSPHPLPPHQGQRPTQAFGVGIEAKPICVFIADGGYKPWSGTTMLVEGVGGSETYIIEMAEKVHKTGAFQVYVFCNCPVEVEIFNGVTYKPLDKVWGFFAKNYVHSCMVSRFIDYLPAVYMVPVENVYLILHDIMPVGSTFLANPKLKGVYCLSDWHTELTKRMLTPVAPIVRTFSYGCANKPVDMAKTKKVRWSFIYSSFPNRGLLPLLQMWGRIVAIQPRATLNLYCDLAGEWVNQNYPEQMAEIRTLLDAYAADEVTAESITVHGWVDKATLAAAWRSADIWFYPCIFEETFCLTALEAATAGVLAVTNGIAALQTTVGDRGIIVPNWEVSAADVGDEPMPALEPIPEADEEAEISSMPTPASTPAPAPAPTPKTNVQITPMHPLWQQRALEALTPFLNTQPDKTATATKTQLIAANQTWAANLTWQNRAADLVSQWTSKYDYKLNYSGIRNIPADQWKIMSAIITPRLVNDLVQGATAPTYNILDINTHTGMSAIDLLRHTMPQSQQPRPLSVHGIECIQLSGIHPETHMHSIQSNVARFVESLPVKARPEFIMHPGDGIKSLMQLATSALGGQCDLVIYTCTSTYDICAHLHIIDELIKKDGGLLIVNMLNFKEQAPHVNYFINSYQYKHKMVPVHDIFNGGECVSVIQYGDGPLPSKVAI
jgi:glycosyltransferase involved in cell wall biosynthesis